MFFWCLLSHPAQSTSPERFKFFDPFGHRFVAADTSVISILIAEDLKGALTLIKTDPLYAKKLSHPFCPFPFFQR